MNRHAIAIAALAAIALIGTIVLLALRQPVPSYLTLVAIAGVSALAGNALPGDTTTSVAASSPAGLLSALGGKIDTLAAQLTGTPQPATSAPALADPDTTGPAAPAPPMSAGAAS